MPIRKFLALALVGAALAGCTTITPEERRAADEKTCLSYGFRRNTEALATCLQRIELDRRAESRALRYGENSNLWNWPVTLRR